MAYSWQSDIIRPDGENGTEVLDTNGVYQPQIEGGDNITIEDGKISASGTLENVNADWSETDPNDPSYIEHKPDLSIYATASGMETELAGKQDVIEDLSTIRSGAEAGSTAVQPGDLAAVATTGSYTSLTNTPQNIVQDASYVHTDNNFTNADKSKLDGIASGAEVNVQSNWNETDPNSDAYIANKPTIPAAQQNADWNASSGVTAILNKPDLSAYATDSELADGLATKQNVISDLDTIRAGAAAGATAAQPSDLPSSDELLPSATSGDAGKVLTVGNDGTADWVTPSAGTVYTPGDGIDITNDVISADVDGTTIGIDSTTKKIKSLQVIPTKTSDLQNDSNFVVASSLATVATSGSYADLSNKPNIPTKTSDLQNDSNFVSSSSLATVATTGSYNDLSNKPVIPPGVTVDQTYSASSTNAQSGTAVAGALATVKQVPSSTSADENKVLTVNSSGNPVWENAAVPASKPLVAGSNITITKNANDVTISATDTTYTAGTGISIDNDEISIDNTVALKTDIPSKGSLMVKSGTTQKELYDAWVAGWTIQSNHGNDIKVYELVKFDYDFGEYAATFNRVYFGETLVYEETFTINGIASSTSAVSFGTMTTKTSNQVPAAYSQTVGKVLTIKSVPDDDPIASWESPATVTVDQTYNAASTNAQSGTAVAGAIAGVKQVPSSTSADENKVLTVNSSGNPVWEASAVPESKPLVAGSNITITENTNDVTISATDTTYTAGDGIDITSGVVSADVDGTTIGIDSSTKKIKLLSTIPSVDQTYSAVSTNAQSGTAVAQAIASIPSSSYTAGDAIDITNNEISVDYDTDTLDTVYPKLTVNMAQSTSSGTLNIPAEIQALASGSSPTTVTIHIPANTLSLWGNYTTNPLRIAFCASNYIKNDEEGDFAQFTSIAVSCTYESSDNYTWIDEQDIELTLPCNSLNGWSSSVTPVKFTISVDERYGNAYSGSLSTSPGSLANPVVFSYPNTSAAQQLAVKNPLPASAQTDSGKVLKVNASGNAEWGTASGTTYTAGNMISIDANSNNAIGVSTTAGITDIQVVNSVPALAFPNVLYLIPEN